MRALPTIQTLAKARNEKIHKLWAGLGYYQRARNLRRAAQIILRDHGGRFPKQFDQLLALPGIGRYTAGAICSIAFNQPQPILDGNVMRVLTRLFGIRGNPRQAEVNKELWEISEQLVHLAVERNWHAANVPHGNSRTLILAPQSSDSSGGPSLLNQSLMELGALICTPKEPLCSSCPLVGLCVACQKGLVAQLPQLGPPKPITQRRFISFVVERDGHLLVQQRAAGLVNSHLWEFPNLEITDSDANPRQAARKIFGKIPMSLEPVCSFKHTITRYRITLSAYRVRCQSQSVFQGARWVEYRRLSALPFTSAHNKILERLSQNRRSADSAKKNSPSFLLRGNGPKSG